MKKYKRQKPKKEDYDKYPWRCNCGEPGFVDLGEDSKKNRYPCQKCYAEMKLNR